MPTCNNCGAFVSSRYVRVYGRLEDRVDRCPGCGPRVDERGRSLLRTDPRAE